MKVSDGESFNDRFNSLAARCDMLSRREGRFLFAAIILFLFSGISLFSKIQGSYVVVGAVLMVGLACLAVAVMSSREISAIDSRLQALLNKEFRGTEWKTKAGAVGVVTEVHSRGRRLRMAFPSGAVEMYDRDMMERLPDTGTAERIEDSKA